MSRTATAAPSAQPPPSRAGSAGLLVLVPLAFAAVAYAPIVRNYFFADDFLNLYRIANVSLVEYLLTPHAGHLLVVRNALFALFHAAFGVRAELYFGVVLLTHLLNVGLLFAAARALTGSVLLACFGATLWGISPLHGGSLGWYSVYGHVVAATAVLLILVRVARLDSSATPPPAAERAGWYGLALVASTSFGVGVGAAVVLPAVIALLCPGWRRWSRRPPLWSLVVVIPLLYVALHWLYVRVSGEPIPGLRELLALLGPAATGPPPGTLHVLGAYARALPAIGAMAADLAAYGLAQLLVGFPSIADRPSAWRVALAGLAALTVAVAGGEPTLRRRITACALLAIACYGTIAVGRAPALQALGAAHAGIAERYHYAASAPLTLVLCLVLGATGGWLRIGRRGGAALLALWLVWVAGSYLRVGVRIDHHDVSRLGTERVLAEIAAVSGRAPGPVVYLLNRPFIPITAMISPLDFPGWGALYAAFVAEDAVDGRPLRFVVQPPALAAAVRRGRRGRALFVASADVPHGTPVAEPAPVDADLREKPFGFGAQP